MDRSLQELEGQKLVGMDWITGGCPDSVRYCKGSRYTVSTTMDDFPEIDTPKPFSYEEAERAAKPEEE